MQSNDNLCIAKKKGNEKKYLKNIIDLPSITIKERSCLTFFVLLQTHSWNQLARVVYQ
jgi:hypothetical protein